MALETVNPRLLKSNVDLYSKILKRPMVNEKVLGRPPFKFIHDLVTIVVKNNGYLRGLYTEEQFQLDNINTKDAKMAFLDRLIDAVGFIYGKASDAKPAKIIAGLEVAKTNKLLNDLAKAITDKKPFLQAVDSVRKGIKPPGSDLSFSSSSATNNAANAPKTSTSSTVGPVKKSTTNTSSRTSVTNKTSGPGANSRPVPGAGKPGTKPAPGNKPAPRAKLPDKRADVSKKVPERVPEELAGRDIERPRTQEIVKGYKNKEQESNLEELTESGIDKSAPEAESLNPESMQESNDQQDSYSLNAQENLKLRETESFTEQNKNDEPIRQLTARKKEDFGELQEPSQPDDPSETLKQPNDESPKISPKVSPREKDREKERKQRIEDFNSPSKIEKSPKPESKQPSSRPSQSQEVGVAGGANNAGNSTREKSSMPMGAGRSARPGSSRPAPPRVMTASRSRLQRMLDNRASTGRTTPGLSPGTVPGTSSQVWPPPEGLKLELNLDLDHNSNNVEANLMHQIGDVLPGGAFTNGFKNGDQTGEDFTISTQKLQDSIFDAASDFLAPHSANMSNINNGSEKGKLMQQLLANKSELEGTLQRAELSAVKSPSTAPSTTNDTVQLRNSVRELCQSVATLTKAVNYLHEDVEPMVAELTQWRQEYRQNIQAIDQLRTETERQLEPLRMELEKIDKECDEFRDKLQTAKSNVFRNSAHIFNTIQSI